MTLLSLFAGIQGMTLRDYFAAMALEVAALTVPAGSTAADIAAAAYAIADAMLVERGSA